MGDRNTGLGEEFFEFGASVLNRFYLVVKEVDLSAALEFA
jgi:hypothetical protein